MNEIILIIREIKSYLMGDLSLAFFIASYFLYMMGAITFKFLDFLAWFSKKPIEDKPSFSYWWMDNKMRLFFHAIAGGFILYGVLLFNSKFTSEPLTTWIPYTIGASLDLVIMGARKFTSFNFFNGVK